MAKIRADVPKTCDEMEKLGLYEDPIYKKFTIEVDKFVKQAENTCRHTKHARRHGKSMRRRRCYRRNGG